MLTQKDATIREDRDKHAAELESMQQIGRALEESAEVEVAQAKAKVAARERTLKDALAKGAREKEDAVDKAKEKFRLAAEEQFEKGKKAYNSVKKDLQASLAALEAQRDRAARLEATQATDREAHAVQVAALESSLEAARAEARALEARIAAASKSELEALSICDEMVDEKNAAAKDKAAAIVDKDNAFASLASATQELMAKDARIAKLQQELKDATANCEELLSLAESLQAT
jgi:hypothetical protein